MLLKMADSLIKSKSGLIALMGSGELTSTMVEVHKELLRQLISPSRATFLDTPAGFQLNADQLSQRAVEYFRERVHHPMSVASFKSKGLIAPLEAELAYRTLKESNFILIGPGSPTYAVRQWQQTPIREILIRQIENGGCLVAASAAALTIGRFTLPVYEIYKVGDEVHWADGLDILSHFGFKLAVVPHWNNAEGGTHDTRFCYMGEPRFTKLEAMLTEGVGILGLDEHTACLMDLERNEASIRGIGRVTLRHHGRERVFEKGERLSLDVFRELTVDKRAHTSPTEPPPATPPPESRQMSYWDQMHALQSTFHGSMERADFTQATSAVLDVDRLIWKAKEDLESEELIAQAREILRELIVFVGSRLEHSSAYRSECLGPVVEEMLRLRENFRLGKKWEEADAIRESLQRVDVIVEDTREGSRWRLG